jgi:hypothetical protein
MSLLPIGSLLLGDGDLELDIHDLRAKVAKDSETFQALSFDALSLGGFGDLVEEDLFSIRASSVLSGDTRNFDKRTFCLATNDFRLPLRAVLGRISVS